MMIWSFSVRLRLRLVALIVAGCAGGDGQGGGGDAVFHGYMVLAPNAVDFGLTPGDTLTELPAARVPAALRQEVERDVGRMDYERGCTRYWASGGVTVVLIERSCTDPPSHSHHGDLSLFRQEGDRFVRHPQEFSAIGPTCPLIRDKRGRPSTPC